MEKALEILRAEEIKLGADYHRANYSIHLAGLKRKSREEIASLRNDAADSWVRLELILQLIEKLEAERVEA